MNGRVPFLLAALFALLLPATAPAQDRAVGATLRFGVMTFTATRDQLNEMVLEADDVLVPPGAETATLEGVHVVMSNPDGGRAFEMTCDYGDLELETSNFRADGNVKGVTADGRRLFTPWLYYDSDRGVISTDAPVRILDGRHTLHGRGFIYHVRDGRFTLKGGASVVQE